MRLNLQLIWVAFPVLEGDGYSHVPLSREA